jgi:hypothetical protein
MAQRRRSGSVGGIRPSIWALAVVCVASLGVIVVAFAGGRSEPGMQDAGEIGETQVAKAAPAARAGRRGASTASAGEASSRSDRIRNRSGVARSSLGVSSTGRRANRPALGEGKDAAREETDRPTTRRGALPGGGGSTNRAGTGSSPFDSGPGRSDETGSEPTGGAPRVERNVAELAEKLGLDDPDGFGDPDGTDPDAAQRDAADAVMVEFLLREDLHERFGGKMVPYAYPVERLRAELTEEVSNLGAAERQALLEVVSALMPEDPRPLVMSHPDSGLVYDGPDAEYDPQGFQIYVAPPVTHRTP